MSDKAKKAENKEAKAALEALVEKMGAPHYDLHKYEDELKALKEALGA